MDDRINVFLNYLKISNADNECKQNAKKLILESSLNTQIKLMNYKKRDEEFINIDREIKNTSTNVGIRLICLFLILLIGVFIFFVIDVRFLKFIAIFSSSLCARVIINIFIRYINLAKRIEDFL